MDKLCLSMPIGFKGENKMQIINKLTHNTTLSSQQFFDGIKQSLGNKSINYENIIRDFGQVTASEKRDRGEPFGFNDHIKGLLLALLSNQRSWGANSGKSGKYKRNIF